MINGTTLWNRSHTADMIEKTFSGKTHLTYPNLPANLYDTLSLSAARRPDKTAVVDDNGTAYIYMELRDMADYFSSYLYYISDIRSGTKTGVMMSNSAKLCVTFLTLTKLGAVVIPLPSKYSRNEVLSLTSKANLQHILCDERFYDWFVPLGTFGVHLVKPGRGKNGFGFSHLCVSYLSSVPSLDREEDDAPIMFTSGTTSQSKGVIVKNYSIMHAIVSYQRIFQIMDRDSALTLISIYLITGLAVLLGPTLYAGGAVYLHKFFDAKRVLRNVSDKEIIFFHSTPAASFLLLREKDSFPPLPSLKLLACGSSNMSKEKLTEVCRWLSCAAFHTVYGLTKTCSPATIFPGDASTSNYIGSSGLSVPGICFCILDDSGSQVQTDQVGEIAVRGTVALDRHYQKGTDELDGDGWLHTGDLGYFNGEGYLFIVDRKKDMINRDGEKIRSFDAENELYRLDGIDGVAVVGVPHDIYDEVPMAAVKLSPESTLTEQQIQELLKYRVAKYMIPLRIIFLDELPPTSNNEVNKSVIRKLFV